MGLNTNWEVSTILLWEIPYQDHIYRKQMKKKLFSKNEAFLYSKNYNQPRKSKVSFRFSASKLAKNMFGASTIFHFFFVYQCYSYTTFPYLKQLTLSAYKNCNICTLSEYNNIIWIYCSCIVWLSEVSKDEEYPKIKIIYISHRICGYKNCNIFPLSEYNNCNICTITNSYSVTYIYDLYLRIVFIFTLLW